jgi:hypothetical protein
LLVAGEAVLGTCRNEHGMALVEIDGLTLHVEHPATFEHDIDLIVFMRLLPVRLGRDKHVDANFEPGRRMYDLVAAGSGRQAPSYGLDVERMGGGERLERCPPRRIQMLFISVAAHGWIESTAAYRARDVPSFSGGISWAFCSMQTPSFPGSSL